MERQNVKKQIIEIINKVSWHPIKGKNEDINFVEDLGMDSIDLVDMVLYIENEFIIDINNEHINEFSTLGKLIDFVMINV